MRYTFVISQVEKTVAVSAVAEVVIRIMSGEGKIRSGMRAAIDRTLNKALDLTMLLIHGR